MYIYLGAKPNGVIIRVLRGFLRLVWLCSLNDLGTGPNLHVDAKYLNPLRSAPLKVKMVSGVPWSQGALANGVFLAVNVPNFYLCGIKEDKILSVPFRDLSQRSLDFDTN